MHISMYKDASIYIFIYTYICTEGTVSLRQVLGDAIDKQDEEALAKMLQGLDGGAAQGA
jgi:hypothetical protein